MNEHRSISSTSFHIDGPDFPPVVLRDCGHYASMQLGAFPADVTIYVTQQSAKAIIEALSPFVYKPPVAEPQPQPVVEEVPL